MATASDEGRYVRLNRNFGNHPWARDIRARLGWCWSEKTGRWWADLNDNVRFRLPGDSDEKLRRAPTAFDYAFKCLLLSEACRLDSRRITFESMATILAAMGYPIDSRHRRRLMEALEYWSALRVRYRDWRVTGGYVTKQLPPLIRKFDVSGPVTIEISGAWIATCDSYYAPIRLPLPKDASALNLILRVLTKPYTRPAGDWPEDELGEYASDGHQKPIIRDNIGIGSVNGGRRLEAAVDKAKTWFAGLGCNFVLYSKLRGHAATFSFDVPAIPKPKKRGKNRQNEGSSSYRFREGISYMAAMHIV